MSTNPTWATLAFSLALAFVLACVIFGAPEVAQCGPVRVVVIGSVKTGSCRVVDRRRWRELQ